MCSNVRRNTVEEKTFIVNLRISIGGERRRTRDRSVVKYVERPVECWAYCWDSCECELV